jgi:hypothetical protein
MDVARGRSEFVRGAGRGGAPTGERGANTNREGVASGAQHKFFTVFHGGQICNCICYILNICCSFFLK